ncbi:MULTISPECIES: beta-N-acetylhexosaminidase [unclassified Pseudoalteromonas]|uniref:beta-N-acetylhexosaminidase n=1 Tax=unclassified Pseudoalteromonas TaxID=194690 RepID=UPI002096F741|nr:beta-N-acetylhexosaminidase [Pseudoalteromonas sp. XMcav2-N]MCO7189123.1 beta-N-acetylhexosaminidase [Pseudoalteromonas sp. XMcav2-N]
MMTHLKALLYGVFICLLVLTTGQVQARNHTPILMPAPTSLVQSAQTLTLDRPLILSLKGLSAQRSAFIQAYYREQFTKFGYQVSPAASEPSLPIIVTVQTPQDATHQHPQLGQNEHYQLSINQTDITISAPSDFGALHALATLSQLLYFARDSRELALLHIEDSPRFPWRGLLLDSVRHFISVPAIKRQLRGMAAAKLNVFHWHLTDDQGWRFVSKAYPRLHQLASDGQYHTRAEIRQVVEYASNLGIRVVPEFDVPGHASAIAVAYPELMTEVKPYQMEDGWGVFEPLLDPSKPEVYTFINAIVAELAELFPDPYLHIGGDEVDPKHWQNSERVQSYMHQHKLNTSADLQAHFNHKVQAILRSHNKKMMGWDEIFHPALDKDVMVQSWRGKASLSQIAAQGYPVLLSAGFYIDQPQPASYHYRNESFDTDLHQPHPVNTQDAIQAWDFTMPRLKGSAVRGKLVLVTQQQSVRHAYIQLNDRPFKQARLDSHLISPDAGQSRLNATIDSWMGPTRAELTLDKTAGISGRILIGNAVYPVTGKLAAHFSHADFVNMPFLSAMNAEAKGNILGGEATLWSELVTEQNLDIRSWPRLFTIAERLWSERKVSHEAAMYQRLHALYTFANAIGLHHDKQFRRGLQSLLSSQSSDADLAVLARFAEQLEPASYYTRHHIRYQQGLYHQNVPLDQLVDFLPVESQTMLMLYQKLALFRQGDSNALQHITATLKAWHTDYRLLAPLIAKTPTLHGLQTTLTQASAINEISLAIIRSCTVRQSVSTQRMQHFAERLKEIQNKTAEIVVAAGVFSEHLLEACRADGASSDPTSIDL